MLARLFDRESLGGRNAYALMRSSSGPCAGRHGHAVLPWQDYVRVSWRKGLLVRG